MAKARQKKTPAPLQPAKKNKTKTTSTKQSKPNPITEASRAVIMELQRIAG